VQAYVYAAYLARAYFALEAKDMETHERFRNKAIELKAAFNRDFWVDKHGWFAMGLDGEKNQIDALASNMGHCLWTGIIDTDKAPIVAERLMAPEMFTGWGIRTLSERAVGYNPMSYHCGSVWPHDNAIIAAGLMRYGFVDEAVRLIMGLFEAAEFQGHRLPELFGGLARDDVPFPVPYPSSCSPQAWAAASPLLCLRTMLRLDPWLPHGKVWLNPVLPPGIGYLKVERIPLGGRGVTVEVADGRTKVEGLPPEVELIEQPRHPLTAA
jgi:glycogen debranching enzyme